MHKFFKSKMQIYGRIKKNRIFFKKDLQFSERCDTIFMLSNLEPRIIRRCSLMAKCDICGKGVTFGIKVSHSHRRTNRTWKPNVKRVKAIVKGTPCHIYACSRCLRSGKVERA